VLAALSLWRISQLIRNICLAQPTWLMATLATQAAAQKSRHTTATVAYQTYDGLGEVEFEYVEDADAVTKFGVINKDVKAFGCYSRGQAHRLGKWTLLMEQNLSETVTFAVSIDSGIVLRPGVVISIADPVKSGSRRLGRITAASTTAVTVDSTDGLPTTTANAPTISACCQLVWLRHALLLPLLEVCSP
jgi:predicted phage tail protein